MLFSVSLIKTYFLNLGRAVNVIVLYSNNASLNPAETYSLFHKVVLEINEKQAGVGA